MLHLLNFFCCKRKSIGILNVRRVQTLHTYILLLNNTKFSCESRIRSRTYINLWYIKIYSLALGLAYFIGWNITKIDIKLFKNLNGLIPMQFLCVSCLVYETEFKIVINFQKWIIGDYIRIIRFHIFAKLSLQLFPNLNSKQTLFCFFPSSICVNP